MRLTKLLQRKISLSLQFFSHLSCGNETYSLCKFEDGEHFGEVKLWLTLCLRREMRLTVIILRISSLTNTDNGQL